MAKKKRKTLLVDLDPFAGATIAMTGEAGETGKTVLSFANGEVNFDEAVVEQGGLYLLPGGIEMSKINPDDFFMDDGEAVDVGFYVGAALKNRLDKMAGDYNIICDFPPSIGPWWYAGLCVVKGLVVPIDMSPLALKGLTNLLSIIEPIKENVNPDLEIVQIVCNLADGREKITKAIVKSVKEQWGEKRFHKINKNVDLKNSLLYQQSVFEYNKRASGAKALKALCKKLGKGKGRREIGVLNHKGGVGKTTVSINLGWGIAQEVWKNGK